MNTPYVKTYDDKGVHTNPIKGIFPQQPSERRDNRAHLRKNRFYGESKNHHLTVSGRFKFKRVKQIEYDKDLNRKTIIHYISA